MKNIIFALIAIMCVISFVGCSKSVDYATAANSKSTEQYIIDTFVIHNHPHEIVIYSRPYAGGIMHSPECWCLTDSI